MKLYLITLLMLLILVSVAVSEDYKNVQFNISIVDEEVSLCYYNGTGMPFPCTDFDLDDYNLTQSSFLKTLRVPVADVNSSTSCEILDDWITIDINPPSVSGGNFTCNPTITCPSPPNTSCNPTLNCPAESNEPLNSCLASLDKKLNPPPEAPASSSALEDLPWGWILIIVLGVFIIYLAIRNFSSRKTDEGNHYDERDDNGYSPPPNILRRPVSPPPQHPDLDWQRVAQELEAERYNQQQQDIPPRPIQGIEVPRKPTPEETKKDRIDEIKRKIMEGKV